MTGKAKLLTILFTTICCVCFSNYSFVPSCGCEEPKPFINSLSKTKLVALVKIGQYTSYLNLAKTSPGSVEVTILKIYKGKEKRKTVKVFGDNGQLCRPYIQNFKPGETWILGLHEGCEEKYFCQHGETKNDFYLHACYKAWLPVSNDSVIGCITQMENTQEKMTIKNFGKVLKKSLVQSETLKSK